MSYLKHLSDDLLLRSYAAAKEMQLKEQFLIMLKAEIQARGLPLPDDIQTEKCNKE